MTGVVIQLSILILFVTLRNLSTSSLGLEEEIYRLAGSLDNQIVDNGTLGEVRLVLVRKVVMLLVHKTLSSNRTKLDDD